MNKELKAPAAQALPSQFQNLRSLCWSVASSPVVFEASATFSAFLFASQRPGPTSFCSGPALPHRSPIFTIFSVSAFHTPRLLDRTFNFPAKGTKYSAGSESAGDVRKTSLLSIFARESDDLESARAKMIPEILSETRTRMECVIQKAF